MGEELTVGESLTIDHVVAKAQGWYLGDHKLATAVSRLQNKKADLPVETVVVALDMLLRPLPSDSYDGPVW